MYEAYYVFEKIIATTFENSNNKSLQECIDQEIEDYIKVHPSSIKKDEVEDFKAVINALVGALAIEAAEDLDKLRADIYTFQESVSETDESNIILNDGMQIIIDTLSETIPNGSLNLNERVVKIEMTNSSMVTVKTENNTFTADHVIVTVPLGVLKTQQDLFSPQLPDEKIQVIENMGFGALGKIYLEWSDPWLEGREPFFLGWTKEELDGQRLPEQWYRSVPLVVPFNRRTKNLLWLNVVGDGARVADTLSDEEVIETATDLMRNFTGISNIPLADKIYRHTWSADPSFRGTYSHPGFGTAKSDYEILMKPLPSPDNPQVLIAGEHTHRKYSATLHGARSSGIMQARKILSNLGMRADEMTSTASEARHH